MENKYNIPSISDLKLEWDKYNEKYPNYSYQITEILLQQVIDILEYSENFLEYLYLNNYDSELENPYVIYGQLVHYIKECHTNGRIQEIKEILNFVDNKLQDKNDEINTLMQVGVLEILDIYPEVLDDIVELMPDFSKQVFLKYFSHYLD